MPLAARWLRACKDALRPPGMGHLSADPGRHGCGWPHNLVYRLWRRGHAGALRAADLIVTLGDHMAAVLRRMADDAALPVTVVPNWVDTDWLTPLPRENNPFARSRRSRTSWWCSIPAIWAQRTPSRPILEVARLLADEPRICFLIIGEGSKRGLVESAMLRGGRPPCDSCRFSLRLACRRP